MEASARILCIGKDPPLLRTRCAVLEYAGYKCQFLMLPEAEAVLKREQFDLCIVSSCLSDDESDHIETLIAFAIPIIKLKELAFALELFRKVQACRAAQIARQV